MELYPEFIARFYDLIYAKVRTGVDNEYYLKKGHESQGRVLEIGVGTGRLFLDALNQGIDIYGIDISPAMVNILHKKMDQDTRHRVWVENAVTLDTEMKFNLILAPFRMFSHIIEVEDQLKVLNRVAHHLLPGGQFILDLFVPNLKILLEGLDQIKDFDEEYEEGKRIQRYVTTKTDLSKQTTSVSMKLCWEENKKLTSKTWKFDMRYFFRYEIEHLISHSNLTLKRIYGDYLENDITEESTEFVIVCTNYN